MSWCPPPPLAARVKGLLKRGLARVARPDRCPGLIILAYHKVGSPVPGEMNVPLPVFRRQMEHLAAHYPVLPLGDAVALAGSGRLVQDVAVLTFDDGYRSLLEHAYPVLAELRLPITVYVCPAFVRTGGLMPWDREPSERVMDWAALREIAAGGLVRCGSHTWSHRAVPGLTAAEIEGELRRPRWELEDRLGQPAADFCYPKGLCDQRSVQWVQRFYATGVVGGFRKCRPPMDLWRLRRIPVVHSDSFPVFLAKLQGGMGWEAAFGLPRDLFRQITGRWPRH